MKDRRKKRQENKDRVELEDAMEQILENSPEPRANPYSSGEVNDKGELILERENLLEKLEELLEEAGMNIFIHKEDCPVMIDWRRKQYMSTQQLAATLKTFPPICNCREKQEVDNT